MILQYFLHFLQGYDTIVCPATETDVDRIHGAVVQALAAEQISAWQMHHTADGGLSFCVARRDTLRLRTLLAVLPLTLQAHHGLPWFVARYRRRLGIPVGVLLFCAALFFFSQILWQVDVTGVTTVPAERIVAELETLGCEAGAWLPGLDLYAISDKLLAVDGELAYVSVVRHGTLLSVRVREKESAPPQGSTSPANLVAKKDGVVLSFAAREGQPMVGVGQAVRAGELLVSGVVLHRGGRISVVRAAGTVYAKTVCTSTVEVPLSESVQVQAGNVIHGRTLKIFGWELNFLKNTGNIDIECDTITERKQWALSPHVLLPIWQETTRTPIYREEVREHTPAEAVRLATERAQAEVRAEMGAAEVLATTTTVEKTESGYRVTYTAECIMDIADCREFALAP